MAFSAPVFAVGAVSGNDQGGTTGTFNSTGCDLIVVSVMYSGSISTFSDSLNNSWTLAKQFLGTNAADANIYYAVRPLTGSSHTITALGSAANAFPEINAMGFTCSGGGGISADQVSAGGGGTTGASTIQPGSITPSANGALVIAAAGTTEQATPAFSSINQSFTLSVNQSGSIGLAFGGGQAYLIQGSAAGVNPTFSTATTHTLWAVQMSFIQTFPAISSAAPPPTVSPVAAFVTNGAI